MRCCWFVGFFPIFAFVPSTRDVVCSISDRAARKYMCLLGAHCACVRALFRIFVYLYSVKWVSGIVLNWPVHGDWHTEEEAHKKSGQHTKFTRSLHVYTLSDNIGCYYLYRLEFNVRCISIFDRFALHPASIRHWLRIVPCGCVCECVQAILSKCALVNLAKSKMLPSVYWMDTNLCYTISFIFLSLGLSISGSLPVQHSFTSKTESWQSELWVCAMFRSCWMAASHLLLSKPPFSHIISRKSKQTNKPINKRHKLSQEFPI